MVSGGCLIQRKLGVITELVQGLFTLSVSIPLLSVACPEKSLAGVVVLIGIQVISAAFFIEYFSKFWFSQTDFEKEAILNHTLPLY